MTGLLSIDPGIDTGWARWSWGVLINCGLGCPEFGDCINTAVVIEKPQIYRASKGKGDPNDLIELAILVGEYQCIARIAGSGDITLITPAEWKGQVPKDIHEKRIVDALLSRSELVTLRHALDSIPRSKRHNVIDAVGLGLWKLGRLARGGVTP